MAKREIDPTDERQIEDTPEFAQAEAIEADDEARAYLAGNADGFEDADPFEQT